MGWQNKIVYLNLKYQDEDDNFDTGSFRPFLIYQIKENKVYLIPLTSRQKKKSFKWQYLVSSPLDPTCLTSEDYPFSYANLNRKIILKFKQQSGFLSNNFCGRKCVYCLPEEKFLKMLKLYLRYWRNPLNRLVGNRSKIKTIQIWF